MLVKRVINVKWIELCPWLIHTIYWIVRRTSLNLEIKYMIGVLRVILNHYSNCIKIHSKKMRKLKELKSIKLCVLKILMNLMNSLQEGYLILTHQNHSMKILVVKPTLKMWRFLSLSCILKMTPLFHNF